jgi:hypothetical protein
LEAESRRLLLQCQNLQTQAHAKAEHTQAGGGESTLQSPSITTGGFSLASSLPPPCLDSFTISQAARFSGKHDLRLPLPSEISPGAQSKSHKRRTPSVSFQREKSPVSPHKRRKANSGLDTKQDAAMRLAADDEAENSLLDIAGVRDEKKGDVNSTQMCRLRLSSAPSLQSATPSCWDTASVLSNSSSGDQSSHSIADS